MKKLLIASAILAASSVASANFYVQADAGIGQLKVEDVKKSKFQPSIALGWKKGNIRQAIDYTNYGKVEASGTVSGVNVDASVKIYGFGYSGIAEFNTDSAFTPYIGLRLSYNVAKIDSTATASSLLYTSTAIGSSTESSVGIGALAGVSYSFTDNLKADLGVNYNYLGSFGSPDSVKAHQYGAKIGLRYEF